MCCFIYLYLYYIHVVHLYMLAAEKEVVKMTKNGLKWAELGWECIPLAVETYGGWPWGERAQEAFNRTSRRLAVGSASSEAGVRQDMYERLSMTLVRENAKAILARSSWPVS